MTKPLDGVRVLEVAMFGFVPAAGAVLADWGADVIKVEHPVAGDPMRGLTIGGISPGTGGITYMWEVFNRGKRSAAVDLSTEPGREIVLSLAERSDVFLTSLRPAALRKLGIDDDHVMARNPSIVYARGSGQGPRGAEADKGGFDSISYWYRSGAGASVTPDSVARPLQMPGPAFGDIQSGAILAGAISAGLVSRMRTGHGVVVDLSLMAAGMWAMQAGIVGTQVIGADSLPSGPGAGNPLSHTYRTADDRYIALAFVEPDRYWPEFCELVGRPEWTDDQRFRTFAARRENFALCVRLLDELFSTRTLAEWQAILRRGEGQWDVVQRVGDLHTDEQARANGYLVDVDYGERTLALVAAPAQFDTTPPTLRPAPALGADTEAVLVGLGFDHAEIASWHEAGTVRCATLN